MPRSTPKTGYYKIKLPFIRYPETLKQFKKALTINPKFAYAHLNIAKAFALVNDKSNAIAHARFTAKLFRKHANKNGEEKAK